MSNKPRVYVAGYLCQGVSRSPQGTQLGPARFHWAVWVVPKGSTGPGASSQVREEDAYPNVPTPGGWRYFYTPDDDYARDKAVIGRLMIGKLPPGVSHEDVHAVLGRVPIPRVVGVEPVGNCVSWTTGAVSELQEWGSAERFEVPGFMEWALVKVTGSFESGEEWAGRGLQENFVSNRKFP